VSRRYVNAARAYGFRIAIFGVSALAIPSRSTIGQPEENTDHPTLSAHLHSPDMSCCAPCLPEENQDADVCKRPCFVRALSKSGKSPEACAGLTEAVGAKLRDEGIPAKYIEGLHSFLNAVLQSRYLPRSWRDVALVVPHSVKSVMEVRNGAPVFVRYEADTGEARAFKEGDAIQTAWTVKDIEVLPRLSSGGGSPRYAMIRLRLHGDERIGLRRTPADTDTAASERFDFFDRDAFHELLAGVFQVPFESSEDFVVDGFDTTCEGVRVFHGLIRSREWETHRREPEAPKRPPHWWDEMRLFVTDSDPQYFCVRIVLRDADVP